MNIRFLIILGGLLLSSLVFGQRKKDRDTSTFIHQPNRIEFDALEYDTDLRVISGGEKGLLVAIESEDRTRDGYNWTFHLVDTLLNVQWSRMYPVPFDSYLIGYEHFGDKFYLLFNASRYRSEDLLLYELDIPTSELRRIEINTVFPVQISHFEVIDRNALLAGYTNFRPVLLRFDLDSQRPQVVPGFYDNNSDILNVHIDDDARMFTVMQSERLPNRKYTVRAKTFTSTADLVQNNVVTPSDRFNLVDGASTIFNGGFQYMAGTYSRKSTQYSKGFYLAKFVNGRQQFLRFHEYADLNNFFGYMSPRREQRVKERIEKKRAKGRKINLSYRLLVHEIIQRDDEYILIAEAYYPRYSNYSTVGTGMAYGVVAPSSMARYNPGFMGYRFTHAIVVSFDRNGNILWDNSFEINDIETFNLEELVAVSAYQDKIVLMYLEENTIRSKMIQGNEIVEGKTFSPVKLAFEDDELKSKNPELEGLKPWYGNAMFAFGEQRIRNSQGTGGKLLRRIFYINKIEYNFGEVE